MQAERLKQETQVRAAREAKLRRLGLSEQELTRLTPSREQLERLAAKFVAPAEWFEEEDVA